MISVILIVFPYIILEAEPRRQKHRNRNENPAQEVTSGVQLGRFFHLEVPTHDVKTKFATYGRSSDDELRSVKSTQSILADEATQHCE